MSSLRDVYAQKALSQLPRLLGNQDRNPLSRTYGCFHRDYWLDKTSDFPDAVRQFAMQALALVYTHDFPGNIYRGEEKICEWAIAALDYWAKIQHKDGSFDEFYPYERGWVGPTAFTTFTSIESYRLLEDKMPQDVAERVRDAISRAAYFVASGESEEDHLANHHAMACLVLWKAYRLLGDPALEEAYRAAWRTFLTYHNSNEGWSREYDGVDPGYLSATVSFLGKIYQESKDPDIREVLQQSVDFASYFVYPNGFYAGSLGSRNTLHFYPHGFEILASEIPMAAAVAEKMLRALGEDKLVPPEIISDRYVVYRVPEFLQAYLDYSQRSEQLPPVPYERESFTQYFPESRIYVSVRSKYYVVANLAKGGVIKVFDRKNGDLILNDCGIIGTVDNGKIVSSQWIDPGYHADADEHGWQVEGDMQIVPSDKLFTPIKNLLFRSALVALGWNSVFSHFLKGQIRKTLILGQRNFPIRFARRFRWNEDAFEIVDSIKREGEERLSDLFIGGEFFVRYVPQSRYFQHQELHVESVKVPDAAVEVLNQAGEISLKRRYADGCMEARYRQQAASQTDDLPFGVYDIEYFRGRQKKRQLVYRLKRRTDEVEAALRRYNDGTLDTIVDVGTADGLMLDKLRDRLGDLNFLGIDYSLRLLQATFSKGINKSQADALALPVRSDAADAVVATAIIEHVPNPRKMILECARILRPGGLLVITTPDPFMERVASTIGLLKESGHHTTFNLHQLIELCEENGFAVLNAQKFMFSPVGFPAEKMIERVLGPIGLKLVMANQLIVARLH